MKIFTDETLRAIDAKTIESGEVTSMQLIEEVAEGAVAEIVSRWNPSKPTLVLAGPGNNGADALSIARLLVEHGFSPIVYLFNIGGNRLSPECKTARDMLLSVCPDVRFNEIENQLTLPDITDKWLVVDGLFGSGLRDSLKGGFLALVRRINEAGATVVSIDVPSGLHGDWNPQLVDRDIMHASLTLGIGFPHIAFLIKDNAELVGEWKVLDLSLSHKAIRATRSSYYYVERNDVKPLFESRDEFSSKADYGSALIIAGSYGMVGASVLAARGALRSGVGKVTVYGPRCSFFPLQSSVPEAMFVADKGENVITDVVVEREFTAIGIGPGIGTSDATVNALERLLSMVKRPIVIDADAINCIARKPSMLNIIPPMSIITPHAGEFDRLFGPQPNAETRLLRAIEMSRRYNLVIVLKGRYTATVRPDGKVYFNSSGTPAMATPGSGDVLTGMITSFMAQGMKPELAAVAAVYAHGVAGEIAAVREGDYGVTAGDIAANVGRAIVDVVI